MASRARQPGHLNRSSTSTRAAWQRCLDSAPYAGGQARVCGFIAWLAWRSAHLYEPCPTEPHAALFGPGESRSWGTVAVNAIPATWSRQGGDQLMDAQPQGTLRLPNDAEAAEPHKRRVSASRISVDQVGLRASALLKSSRYQRSDHRCLHPNRCRGHRPLYVAPVRHACFRE